MQGDSEYTEERRIALGKVFQVPQASLELEVAPEGGVDHLPLFHSSQKL